MAQMRKLRIPLFFPGPCSVVGGLRSMKWPYGLVVAFSL